MAEKAPKRDTDRKRIFESRRYKIMLFCALLAIMVGSTATFAWYGANEREADSAPADIMKPYYLNLRNPSDTADLQLTVGNLFPGDVKQVVFCVSNKNNEVTGLDMGVTTFEYSIELIHTENLALEYSIYELTGVAEGTAGAIAALDIVEIDGVETEKVTYWVKTEGTDGTVSPLTGTDVSTERHKQAGIVDASGNPVNASVLPINAGKYTAYKNDASGNALQLEAGEDENGPTFDSQYFLIEIDWEEGADAEFEKYEKETDMIYLLVEALQPKPQKKDTTQITTE